jgi:hypothetical protein
MYSASGGVEETASGISVQCARAAAALVASISNGGCASVLSAQWHGWLVSWPLLAMSPVFNGHSVSRKLAEQRLAALQCWSSA